MPPAPLRRGGKADEEIARAWGDLVKQNWQGVKDAQAAEQAAAKKRAVPIVQQPQPKHTPTRDEIDRQIAAQKKARNDAVAAMSPEERRAKARELAGLILNDARAAVIENVTSPEAVAAQAAGAAAVTALEATGLKFLGASLGALATGFLAGFVFGDPFWDWVYYYDKASKATTVEELAEAAELCANARAKTEIYVGQTLAAMVAGGVAKAIGRNVFKGRGARLADKLKLPTETAPKPAVPPLEEMPTKSVFHKGELTDGKVTGGRELSTGIDRAKVEALNRPGPVSEFRIPKDVLRKWMDPGLARTIRDFDSVTGVYNEEIRFDPSLASEVNKYMVK